jgi:hypothetical protein
MPDDRQDLIADYLRELGTRLRTPDADLVLAETEDHLRESVAAGLAVGMTAREAQEAAISAFGPVRAVVRAHQIGRPRQLAADLVMAGFKLGGGRLRRASPPRPAPSPSLRASRPLRASPSRRRVAATPPGMRHADPGRSTRPFRMLWSRP